jgi:hypothetical protein
VISLKRIYVIFLIGYTGVPEVISVEQMLSNEMFGSLNQ